MKKLDKITSSIKGWFFFILFLTALFILSPPSSAESQKRLQSKNESVASAVSKAEQNAVFPPMPRPGKKVSIGKDHYLVYGFDRRLKLGPVMMKVEIYTRDGRRDTSMEVKADTGMPSMKGHHEMGDRPMRLSENGDYRLPIYLVMPGDWEIRLTVSKDGKVIFKGSYQFDV